MCRCGMILSSRSRNSIPSQKPIKAGRNAHLPLSAHWFIAGIRRLQIDAATITPPAKPVNARCTVRPSCFFIKNTHAEPAAVPINGIAIPSITLSHIPFLRSASQQPLTSISIIKSITLSEEVWQVNAEANVKVNVEVNVVSCR